MIDGSAPAPAPRSLTASPLWMRVLLVVSLALNLLVVGVVAGALARRPPDDFGRGAPGDPAAAFYLGALPPESRREVIREMFRNAGDFRASRQAVIEEVQSTLALIRAETVDTAALHEAVRRQRGALAERREVGDGIFVDYIARMSPEDRRAYADRLEEMLRRPWRR
jgi:uncharacterized membrane protein